MIEYTPDQQKIIKSFFSILNKEDIQYVICRGFQNLPKSVPGNDIDFLVDSDAYTKIRRLCDDFGFEVDSRNYIDHIISLISFALNSPKIAIKKLTQEPLDALRLLFQKQKMDSSNSLRNQYSEFQAVKNNVHIHFFNHLAYKSPKGGLKVRVHPTIEQGMFERRRKYLNYYVPAPPDELVHLVCRGVFDKDGQFPEYYIERCNELYDKTIESKRYEDTLHQLLSKVFFKLDGTVEELIREEKYNDIKFELRKSTNY